MAFSTGQSWHMLKSWCTCGDPEHVFCCRLADGIILEDPGADSGGKGKTKRAEKNGVKKSNSSRRSLLFFAPFVSARLVFPLPPLSAPGSPRMRWNQQEFSFVYGADCLLIRHQKVDSLPSNSPPTV